MLEDKAVKEFPASVVASTQLEAFTLSKNIAKRVMSKRSVQVGLRVHVDQQHAFIAQRLAQVRGSAVETSEQFRVLQHGRAAVGTPRAVNDNTSIKNVSTPSMSPYKPAPPIASESSGRDSVSYIPSTPDLRAERSRRTFTQLWMTARRCASRGRTAHDCMS